MLDNFGSQLLTCAIMAGQRRTLLLHAAGESVIGGCQDQVPSGNSVGGRVLPHGSRPCLSPPSAPASWCTQPPSTGGARGAAFGSQHTTRPTPDGLPRSDQPPQGYQWRQPLRQARHGQNISPTAPGLTSASTGSPAAPGAAAGAGRAISLTEGHKPYRAQGLGVASSAGAHAGGCGAPAPGDRACFSGDPTTRLWPA